MFEFSELNNPPVSGKIIPWENEITVHAGIQVMVWVDDKGPIPLRGNKWHKLKYNLLEASDKGIKSLLTFGGNYSNHIAATACSARRYGFHSIGIIRGEEPAPLTKTLLQAQSDGMQLHYVSRSQYREKMSSDFQRSLKEKFGDFYLLPEGGSNLLALKGCKEWLESFPASFDVVCCACGTGATVAGLISGLKSGQRAIGFSVLKKGDFLIGEIESYLNRLAIYNQTWNIQFNYHEGGYAKTSKGLTEFIKDFNQNNSYEIEPVYTGKMFFGLADLIKKKYFVRGTKILAIHTGGLQYL